ncbi:MAG: FHA domain-containing protein, partial [Planctomycetes bacterium]|nr:FHA domain-containing protein [Planctomycetota bacterium]
MAELIILAGKMQGRRILLPEREVLIGRDSSCHLRLTSSLVSHQHCALSVSPEGIRVRDLGSQNGTFINDVEVTEPQLLRAGDVLRVGSTLFEVPDPSKTPLPATKKSTALEISDADIANWLTDDAAPGGPKESDTTVIPKKIDGKTELMPTIGSSGTSATPERKAYRSVKEEAAAI